jgi:hypothetical protein
MNPPRFRFTVRGMMLAVAVAGMACGGEVVRRRRAAFLAQAEVHRALADYLSVSEHYVLRPGDTHLSLTGRRRAEVEARLAAKYERAARHPWLPVAPDPPEPE